MIVVVKMFESPIDLLKSGSAEGKTEAERALCALAADNVDNLVRIAREGGIEPLITLMRDGSAEGKKYAAKAQRILAANADNRVRIERERDVSFKLHTTNNLTLQQRTQSKIY